MGSYDHVKCRETKLEDHKSVTCCQRDLPTKEDSMCDIECDQESRKLAKSFREAKVYSVNRKETKKSLRSGVIRSSSEVKLTSSRERNNHTQTTSKVNFNQIKFLINLNNFITGHQY